MEKEVILSIKDLVIKFKSRENVLSAIRNISLDIYDGETLAIVGESGSGKSVLTKVFTAMLDRNGWVSNGAVTFKPTKRILEDKDAYFRKPTHLVDFTRILLDNDMRKNVIKFNNKMIRTKKKQIENINNLNLSEVDDEIQKNQDKIKELKQKIDFNSNTRIIKKIDSLKNEINKLQEYRELLNDNNLKTKVIKAIEQEIETCENDNNKIKKLTLIDKYWLKKNIAILKKYIDTNTKPSLEQFEKIQHHLTKRNFRIGIGFRIMKLNKKMLDNQEITANDFENLIDEWNLNKNFNFINKMRAAKRLSKLRGLTIATIFQDPMTSLNPLLSVGFQITEVLRKHHKMSKAEAKKVAIDLLKKVGIPNAEKRYHDIPGMYSGGMRQRVVIAIALACRPRILICDEPTTALDVTIQAQILDLIKELQKEYKFTVIFITHDLGVVANIANRVAVMYAGQIIEYGTIEDIFFDPKHPYTWALLSSLPQFGVKGEELYSIPGTPPSLNTKIKGDAFAPRNNYAMKIDYLAEPPMFKVSETHYAKTWLLDPRAANVEKPSQLEELKNLNNEVRVGE